uniref:Uncharacterized protein n=1 Tax=Solanum lycopersicum TaxID=4081 RepID=A0A3Q7ECA4_SOLLC
MRIYRKGEVTLQMLSPPMPNTPSRFHRISRVSTADPISLVMERISDVERYHHDNSICPMGERRGLNPRVVDSQSTALIHLATSDPTLRTGETKLQQVEASWQSFKQRGWAVHFIDLTSLYLRLMIGVGRAVKALVDIERAASTYSYQNEKQQAELELEEAGLYKRKPLRASPLYRVPNLSTHKLQAFFEAPTTCDI